MKIVVIGESCIDTFIYCTADRICPEAPVPVIVPQYTTTNPGMAGNTHKNLKTLTPTTSISLYTQTQTINKTRYIEKKSNQMFIRVDSGEHRIDRFEFTPSIVNTIKEADYVVVSDYNKGFLEDADIKAIGRLSKLSILDSKRKLNDSTVEDFTFIKLNEKEHSINRLLSHKQIITTLGDRGAMFKEVIYPADNPRETIDVSGAGDTFTAAFITKYFITRSPSTSIQFANKLASKVVSKRGVVTC